MNGRDIARGIAQRLAGVIGRKKGWTREALQSRIMKAIEPELTNGSIAEGKRQVAEHKRERAEAKLLEMTSERDLWRGRYEGALEMVKVVKPFAREVPDRSLKPIDSESLYSLLSLVIEDIDKRFEPAALDALTVEERRELEEWATATHAHASDNDDVVVPPRPKGALAKLLGLCSFEGLPGGMTCAEPADKRIALTLLHGGEHGFGACYAHVPARREELVAQGYNVPK